MVLQKMRKTASGGLTVLLMASLLAACGSGNNANSPSPQASTGGSTGATDQKVTLRMIESLTSPARTTLLQAMITKFQDANKNITVELISPPFDQADNKIRTMLSAKQDIDIIEARDLNVAEFVNNQYLEPLTSYASAWSDYATVTPVSKSVGSVGDTLYYVPSGLYQRQMFYRADWFKELGLTPPKTWEELYATGLKLTDPAKNRFGFSFRGGPGSNGVTDAMILGYNADQVNLEDSMFLKDGKTIFSTPQAKEALDLYLKIYKDISPSDSVNWGFQEQVQAFTSGVTGILLQDPDVIQVLTEGMEEGTWATAPVPTGPTGKALIAAGGSGWAITAYSEKKDAAWKLIEFLSAPENNTQFSKDFGLVPIHSTATEDEYFQTGPYKTLLDMSNMPDTFVNYKPPFQYAGTGKWGDTSTEGQQAYLLGSSTAEELLAKWDAYWVDQKKSAQ